MSETYIGIDLGGTNIKIGCFDSELNLIGKTSVATKADMGPDAVVERMGEAIEKLLSECDLSVDEITAAGIGTPGPAKYKDGVIIKSTNMPKFVNVPIRQMVSEVIGGKPVVFENDANVACWGEYAVGAGKGAENMVFFTLGTGIGGGIITHGKLLNGSGDNAAELGHLIIQPNGRGCNCGQKGCVEAYASASATARRATEAVESGAESSLKMVLEEKGEITCKDVYKHLGQGDELAKKITDETKIIITVIPVLGTYVAGFSVVQKIYI